MAHSPARPSHPLHIALERLAAVVTRWVGGSWALTIATALVLGWLISGPIFDYSETWQLVINTTTTIITFLMVFLIQRSQNKEAHAMQLKLNEIVAAIEGASNRLIDVESLTEDELAALLGRYRHLVEHAQHDASFTAKHSIEEEGRARESKRRSRPARAGEKPHSEP
jgi:low affinity Fe/Cu permease